MTVGGRTYEIKNENHENQFIKNHLCLLLHVAVYYIIQYILRNLFYDKDKRRFIVLLRNLEWH